MDLLRTLRLVRRRAKWIVAVGIVFAAAGYLSAALVKDDSPLEIIVVRYSARHTFIVNNRVDQTQRLAGTDNLLGVAQRVALGEIPQTVATTLTRDPADVARRVRVTVRTDAQTVAITTFDESAEAATTLADTYASALLAYLGDEAEQVYQDRVQKAQVALDEAEARLRKVRSDLAAAKTANDTEKVRQLEQDESLYVGLRIRANSDVLAAKTAGVPVVPLESLEPAKAVEVSVGEYDRALFEGATGLNVKLLTPNDKDGSSGGASGGSTLPDSPLARGAGGLFAGLVLAFAAVFVIDKLDPRIRTKEDAERLLDLPVIAEIPALTRRERKRTDLVSRREPLSHTAESFRRFRSALDYASLTTRRAADANGAAADAGRGQVILITSPGPSEGKTTSVANLANVMAEHNRQVLVINCDFRRPRVQHYLRGSDAPQQVHQTEVPGVNLITHVLADELAVSPAEVVAAQRKVIERARRRFDTILLDTAPLLTTNDAADVLAVADMVVLIVHAGRTTREAADRAAELLARREAPLVGIVLVGSREALSGKYYYEGDDGYLRRSKHVEQRRAETKTAKRRRASRGGSLPELTAPREAATAPPSAPLRSVDDVVPTRTAPPPPPPTWVDGERPVPRPFPLLGLNPAPSADAGNRSVEPSR